MVPRPQCDCTVYGAHALGRDPYLVIAPSGRYGRYCDGDCVAQQLQADRAQVIADVSAEWAAEVAV
ncbi:MAG TPA: hypothetical protein VII06_43190 [Chloroflexota bacterium]|jgi:hypothetical protein